MNVPNIEHIDFLKIPYSNTSSIAIAENALRKGIRVDGRTINQRRNLNIEFLSKTGHVIVSIGNTKVFAAVYAETVQPNVERPNEGILSFNLEISPMCSQSYEPARSSEREHSICHTIEKVFKESGSLDVESLCIIAGKYVWCIRTNIHVLQDDGNLLDVCNVAALVALANFRKPETIAKHEQMQSVELDFNYSSPLTLYHMPLLVSVGVPINADYNLLDNSRFEENIVKTHIAMLFNQFGDLFFIQKHGGVAVPLQRINHIIDVGKRAAVDLYGAITAQMRTFSEVQKDKVKQRHKHYTSPTINVLSAP